MKQYKTCWMSFSNITEAGFVNQSDCVFEEACEVTQMHLRIIPMNPLYRSSGKWNKEADVAFNVQETLNIAWDKKKAS